MIKITQGNIVTADTEAIVNTVNCVGYMGKGIALQFKKAFPDNYDAYRIAANHKEIKPGRMFIFETRNFAGPKYVINFPTKRHWRGKSSYQDIENGLTSLVEDVQRLHISSIAIPALGCGLGGLDWAIVKPMIESAFANASEVNIFLYEPVGSPAVASMPVRTKCPELTISRALFLRLMDIYGKLDYSLTLLEIQKLAYFLQESGQALRLKYEAGHYGPYAPNLNKVLEILEGHYITGYGDSQKPDVEIKLKDNAVNEANTFLINNEEENERLKRVGKLISGFETPYGMELLSSVHWLATHKSPVAVTYQDAIRGIADWNIRKKKNFTPQHIHVAWDRLTQESWILR